MTFQNPRGLWLLLGVPVLILIWLIRPPYEERRVSSSYIWRLSERFMKKRLPVSRIRKWLVFLLQLLLVSGAAFLAARPVLNHGGRVDYLLILDASASMRTVTENGNTRYEEAGEQIRELARRSTAEGHTVSVIRAGDRAEFLVRESASAKEITDALNGTLCGWGTSALSGAMTLAQLFLYDHPGAEVILFTDQAAGTCDGIEVVSLDGGEWNAALTDLMASKDGAGGMKLSASLSSWGRDADITVGLTVNGRLTDSVNVSCPANEAQSVAFTLADAETVTEAVLFIDPGDALEADNRIVCCPENERICDTLLVSETPFYLSAAVNALDRGRVKLTSPGSDGAAERDYDLYVYDGCLPDMLPEAGAVLLIDPPRAPEGMTFLGTAEEAGSMTASAASGLAGEGLLTNMKLREIAVSRHTIADASDDWVAVCSVGQDPVFLTRTMENGTLLCVLLFDLHDANLPLTTDFIYLVRNLMNAAVPPLLDRRIVTVGERVTVNAAPGTEKIRVTSPAGIVTEPETDEGGNVKLRPDEAGLYRVMCGGEETGFFAAIPAGESAPGQLDDLTLLPGESGEEEEAEAASGLWRIAAAVLLAVLLTEWGIYIYEQQY